MATLKIRGDDAIASIAGNTDLEILRAKNLITRATRLVLASMPSANLENSLGYIGRMICETSQSDDNGCGFTINEVEISNLALVNEHLQGHADRLALANQQGEELTAEKTNVALAAETKQIEKLFDAASDRVITRNAGSDELDLMDRRGLITI